MENGGSQKQLVTNSSPLSVLFISSAHTLRTGRTYTHCRPPHFSYLELHQTKQWANLLIISPWSQNPTFILRIIQCRASYPWKTPPMYAWGFKVTFRPKLQHRDRKIKRKFWLKWDRVQQILKLVAPCPGSRTLSSNIRVSKDLEGLTSKSSMAVSYLPSWAGCPHNLSFLLACIHYLWYL